MLCFRIAGLMVLKISLFSDPNRVLKVKSSTILIGNDC